MTGILSNKASFLGGIAARRFLTAFVALWPGALTYPPPQHDLEGVGAAALDILLTFPYVSHTFLETINHARL